MIVLKAAVSGGAVEELAFAPDGRALASPGAGGPSVRLWRSLTGGAKGEVLALPVTVRHVAFTADGAFLLAGNDQVCAVRLATGAVTTYPIPRKAPTTAFAPTPDGTRVLMAEPVGIYAGTRFTLWPVPYADAPLWEASDDTFTRWRPMFVSPDRFVTLVWRQYKGLCLSTRSAADGSAVSEVHGIPEYPEHAALSPDGRFVACQVRGLIHVQPVAGPFHRTADIRNDTPKYFTGLAYHPSGKYLAATSNDKTVKLYDTGTWAIARTFTWNIGRMRSIAFSPDGTLAAAGSENGKVIVWDVDL